MKKLLALVLVAAMATGTVFAATYKTVPTEVADWYKDTIQMFADLVKGLDSAKDSKAATKVVKSSTEFAKTKKLAVRKKELDKKYPEFFDNEAPDTAWIPPADWTTVTKDYEKQMETFGNSMGKIMKWAQDDAFMAAFEELSAAIEEMDGAKD